MTDRELLKQYARNGDREAFDVLVRRHVDMVHSAARRQAPQAADDVVQAVFLLLAQKAVTISPRVSVAGWLYRAVRYCCANVNKMEDRRRHYEREAATMAMQAEDQSWTKLLPLLDQAMDALARRERDAVLLRYLEAKSIDQTALELGISAAAAAKRAGRGLEKLRKYFARQGYAVPLAAVDGLMAAEAVKAAPAGAAGLVHTVVAAGEPGASPAVFSLMKEARKMMMLAKIKLLAAISAMCVLVSALAAVVNVIASGPALSSGRMDAQVRSQSPSTQPAPTRPDASPIQPEDFLPGKSSGVVYIGGFDVVRGGAYQFTDGGMRLFELLRRAQGDATAAGLWVMRRGEDGKRRILDIAGKDIAAHNPQVNIVVHADDLILVLGPDGRLNRVVVVVTPDKLYMNGRNIDWDGVRAELESIPPVRRKTSFVTLFASVKHLPEGRFSQANERLAELASRIGMVKVVNAGVISDITVFYLDENGHGGRAEFSLTHDTDTLSKIAHACILSRVGFHYITVIRGIYEGGDSKTVLDSADVQRVLAGKNDDLQIQPGDTLFLSKIKGATTRP